MNHIDSVVTKVLGKPTFRRCEDVEWWEVWVEYNSWGRVSEQMLWKKTEAEINEVKEGFKFLA